MVAACAHDEGRVIASPVVRDMLRALGWVTCPRCHQVIALLGRGGRRVRER